MPGMTTRSADVMVMSPGADPLTGFSASEISFPMPANIATAATIDTGLVEMPASRIKSIAIVVTSVITFAAGQTGTVQLFAARSRYGVIGGDTGVAVWGTGAPVMPTTPYFGSVSVTPATSTFPTGNVPNTCQLVGPAVPVFTPSATSFAAGIYWVTSTSPGSPTATPPTSATELSQWYPVLGVELRFTAAATAGAYQVFMEVAPL
jgi:hypothetical protein